MTLQDKLDAFKAEFESGQLPFTLTEQEHALMRKAIQTQIAAGIAERALKVGDAAPGFTLSDCENRSCSSAALLAGPAGRQFLSRDLVPLLYARSTGPAGHIARHHAVRRAARGRFAAERGA